jgi:hypothetical protein
VANQAEAEQCDDDFVYCAMDQATGDLETSRRRGTSDRFPRDCRAPSDGSIHKTCGGAGDGWTKLLGTSLVPVTAALC